MEIEQNLWGIGLGVTGCVVVAVLYLLVVYLRHLRDQGNLIARDLEILKQTVGALCSSSVGVDRRVNRLERQGRDLEERQENIECSQQQTEPPYGDAIKMVREGSDADELVQKLGLSRSAADLIIMIHGMKGVNQLGD
jgi:hypothetical protein